MAGIYDNLLKTLFSLTGTTTNSSNSQYTSSVLEDVVEDDDNSLNDYDDHTPYTSDVEFDNSNLSYVGMNICIKLNNKNSTKIGKSEKVLCDKFPKLKEIPSGNRMEKILNGLFPEGFSKHMYIRNLTFTNQSNGLDIKRLGIRLERTPGDFLDGYIPDDVSLLFKGYIVGKFFIVNSIHEVANTEQLDFLTFMLGKYTIKSIKVKKGDEMNVSD